MRVNDDPLLVKTNRAFIAKAFGINPYQLVFSGQTHDDKVALINSSFLDIPEHDRNIQLHGFDAMVTNQPGICLCILTADCASVLLYDAVTPAIGIVHAGWKGTVKKIAVKTIAAMTENFGSNPEDIVAAIGPCICADSFEVGQEVAGIFEDTFANKEGIILRKSDWLKPHVDIVAANFEILKEVGVKPENIETSGICTFQNDDRFFSARKQAEGRFGAGLMMR
jgi:YfiH family protein